MPFKQKIVDTIRCCLKKKPDEDNIHLTEREAEQAYDGPAGHTSSQEEDRCFPGQMEQSSESHLDVSVQIRGIKSRNCTGLEATVDQIDRTLRNRPRKLVKSKSIADLSKHDSNADFGSSEYIRGTQASLKCFEKDFRARGKDEIPKLREALATLRSSTFSGYDLSVIDHNEICRWTDLIAPDKNGGKQPQTPPDKEENRRLAIWEVFNTERVLFKDHLMVLKHCFMEPLKRLQDGGHLMFVEPTSIFSIHLDALCQVSYTFCKELLTVLKKNTTPEEFWPASSLIEALEKFSKLSHKGNIFHAYTESHSKRMAYLEEMRKDRNFVEFEKWCSQDRRCEKLNLNDLLATPWQRCSKFGDMLRSIYKYTSLDSDREKLEQAMSKDSESMRILDKKIGRMMRLQELQQQMEWPKATKLYPRTSIPETLRLDFSPTSCSILLTCPTRDLLKEGPLSLIKKNKKKCIYLFLFTDMLLLTIGAQGKKTPGAVCSYNVYTQPIELECLQIHDVESLIKNAFVLVQQTSFQQVVGLYTLECDTKSTKDAWLSTFTDAKSKRQLDLERKKRDTPKTFPTKDKSPKIRRASV